MDKPVTIAVMPPQMINGPGGGMMRHPMDQPSYPGAPFPGPHQPRPDQYSNYPMGRGQGNYVMMSQHGGPVNGKDERTRIDQEKFADDDANGPESERTGNGQRTDAAADWAWRTGSQSKS